MMKKKKWSYLLQTIALSLVAIMLLGTSSMAGNIVDHAWGWADLECTIPHIYNPAGVTISTLVRVKEDDTSTYCHMTNGTLTYVKMVIMGCSNTNKDNSKNCTGGNKDNPSAYLLVPRDAADFNRYFQNSVRESGLDYSYLYFYSNTSGTGYGVWSPDSV